MRTGLCRGCGERVKVDAPPNGHTGMDHDPSCNGNCKYCPVLVLCGPVELDPDYGDEQEEV